MDTHAQVELDVFCSLLQTSGLLVGAIGSQVPREPCQAAMVSPVSFWKASGLDPCEQGWAARTPEVLIQKGVQKHAGGPQTPDSARRGPVRAQPAFANMSRERANPNGLRKHESGTGQLPFAILTVLNMSRELFAILGSPPAWDPEPKLRSRKNQQF